MDDGGYRFSDPSIVFESFLHGSAIPAHTGRQFNADISMRILPTEPRDGETDYVTEKQRA